MAKGGKVVAKTGKNIPKRPRQDESSESEVEEWEHNINELKEQVQTEGGAKTLDLQKLVLAIYEAVINLNTVNKRMAKLEEENEVLKAGMKERDERMESLEAKLADAEIKLKAVDEKSDKPEIEEAKKGVVITGLKQIDDTEADYAEQLNFLNMMKVPTRHIDCTIRLPVSKATKDRLAKLGKPVTQPLLVRFSHTEAKYNFMRNLGRLRDIQGGESIHVNMEVPRCRLTEYRFLQAAAATWRKEQKGRKTRVLWDNAKLKLQRREPESSTWVNWAPQPPHEEKGPN